ncbi:MAG TPA: hypothetical protein GX731_01585 [Clostridiales bacterium]|nr:hypothetical protein [Clostridiales bacterium]
MVKELELKFKDEIETILSARHYMDEICKASENDFNAEKREGTYYFDYAHNGIKVGFAVKENDLYSYIINSSNNISIGNTVNNYLVSRLQDDLRIQGKY